MGTFGEVLKSLIEREENLNQAEFAKVLNVGKSSVTNWIRNRRVPDLDTLKKIADYFDVSFDYLLGRSELKKGRILKAKEIANIFPESIKLKYLANDDLVIEINESELSKATKEDILQILKRRNIY